MILTERDAGGRRRGRGAQGGGRRRREGGRRIGVQEAADGGAWGRDAAAERRTDLLLHQHRRPRAAVQLVRPVAVAGGGIAAERVAIRTRKVNTSMGVSIRRLPKRCLWLCFLSDHEHSCFAMVGWNLTECNAAVRQVLQQYVY